MPGTFKVSIGWYGTPEIISHSATPEQVAFLKRAVNAFVADDPFYQAKQAADPYLEAISTDLVRVTFESPMEVAKAYVDWLNSVYDQTIVEFSPLYVKPTTDEPVGY